MNDAIGLIETKGLLPLVEATDAMAKAANVQIISQIQIGGAFLTVLVKGDVGSVKAAVDAARASIISGDIAVHNYTTDDSCPVLDF